MSRKSLQRVEQAEIEDGLAELEPDEDELSCYEDGAPAAKGGRIGSSPQEVVTEDPDDAELSCYGDDHRERSGCFSEEVVAEDPNDAGDDGLECGEAPYEELAHESLVNRSWERAEREHCFPADNELDDSHLFPDGEDPVFSAT